MTTEKIVTDEMMEFLRSEVFNAYASGDILSYTTKDGTEYSFKITQIFGADAPELNDGFHAFATVLLDEKGAETDQTVFAIRGTSGYPDCYADVDDNACGWPIFMEHKDDVLAWYNEQKNTGKEVSFTGVSLGGCLSQMFAGYIHQETGDTLKSVVTFSAPGLEKCVTYEGVTYDFSGTIAETVHHYVDSGDIMMQSGNYYIDGDIYLYGCNYYLDQVGDGGKVVRLRDYLLQPHALVKYLLSDEYSALQQAVFITEMKSSDMTGSWSPLSVTVDEIPEGLENTSNAVVTVGDNTYIFNKAYAEIMLSMGISSGATLELDYANKYISRQKWAEIRGTEEGRQDFLGIALMMDFTTDINVGISGSFRQDDKDYAVITLTGKTEQGRTFLYSFSDGCFLETEEVVADGNWQDIAGAQTYSVEFDELPSVSESSAGQVENNQDKTYSTEVTNEILEASRECALGEHQVGDVFEYTSQAGLTYRLKYTDLYGSDDPKINDGFHAAGLVLLDVDGVTETDEHFLVFRGTTGFPDAIADFYKDAAGLPIFAAHTQDVLDWYEKYAGEKITFTGSSLGCALAQCYAGWLVNDKGKDQLTRLVGFMSAPIVKEATYEGTTYHFITDETVAETVEYYRHEGDVLAGLGEYYQKGTFHLYGSNVQLDQANGIKLHEYLSEAHTTGTYLKGGSDALTWLGDFDSSYFDKDANYSDLAVEVDAVPEGLEKTNIEAVTCGDKVYLFNTEYADVALTFVSFNMANYDETLEDFFGYASKFTCRNHWEECRGTEKQETMALLMLYDNTSDIEVSTGRGLTLDDKDYVELANNGSSWGCSFFYNFTDREFVAGYDLASASSLGEAGGVTFSVNGDQAAVALAGEVITLGAQEVAGYYCTGFTSDQVTITGDQFAMPEGNVTITANYARKPETPYDLSGDASGIAWQSSADSFDVQYSKDNFASVLELQTDTCGVDTYALPQNTYGWRVKTTESTAWSQEDMTVTSEYEPEQPVAWKSNANDRTDLFFANAIDTWRSGYVARNVGVLGSWEGTHETATISGKNRLTDTFIGSVDASILVLTDDDNGDVLFVDDIFTAFPEEHQSRIAQIDEIRAGAGDDVVDLTSQSFEYIGGGVLVRGGSGNDIVWANKGENKLFGDAGNDRLVGSAGDDVLAGGSGDDSMHGGGGNDIYAFGGNWGRDTVEQLSDGRVTLWFESGSEENWDQDSLTYTDGENSVKVTGVSEVTLKFGNDGTEQYNELAASGSFLEESSEKIFENPERGMLA